jgi:8-oxo-dGTP diphosphatase
MRNREYPERPMVGVGGVVITGERVLLARRGGQPARGEWSIPGGLLEAGETLIEGVVRELREETGLTVRVVELIEVLERIFPESEKNPPQASETRDRRTGPRYHFVIIDYLCEVIEGEPRAGDDASELAFAPEEDLPRYGLTPAATRVIGKAFALARARGKP